MTSAPGEVHAAAWDAGDQALIELRSPADEDLVTRVQVYRNGRVAGLHERSELASRTVDGELALQVPVDLVGEGNELELRVYGDSGQYVRLPVAQLELPPKPTPRMLHVLAVGIAQYQVDALKLRAAADDARAVAARLYESVADDYEDMAEPVVLLNDQATRENILAAFSKIAAAADDNDAVLLYFAGHGDTNSDGYSFLPYDVSSEQTKFEQGLGSSHLSRPWQHCARSR